MAEYISRDWLLTHTHTGMDTIQMMQTMIDAPAADVVEVRHGRWIKREHNGEYGFPDGSVIVLFHCSLCDWARPHNNDDYCPHCGAKMDGGMNA